MSDATVVTDEKKVEKPSEKSIGQEIREKSFQQILQEQQQERIKTDADPTPDENLETKTREEEEKKSKEAEAQKKAESEAAKQAEETRQADLAKRAAEEVVAKQEAEKKAEADRLKAEEERQEILKPRFTAVDAEGNPLPKSYEELAAESARIGEERAIARMEAKQAAERAEQERIVAEKTQNDAVIREQQKAASDQLQKELDSDLDDLYKSGKLPKIKDPEDPNDPGNKEFKNLFETAQRVNAERLKKGEPPIRSIKLIYYEHYKPLEKPAGHDAPVMGAESTSSEGLPDDKYIPARDRNKSMTQLLREEATRAAKKLGIRSN